MGRVKGRSDGRAVRGQNQRTAHYTSLLGFVLLGGKLSSLQSMSGGECAVRSFTNPERREEPEHRDWTYVWARRPGRC